jgi:glycosyltransferase involved in cell wall biosynthesis
MPKVLRIINRFNVGGPTYNAVYLTSLLCGGNEGEMRFETRLIGGSPAEGEAHSGYIARAHGVEIEEIETMSRRISLLSDLRSFIRIIRIIREFRPDIVHTHAAKAGALGRLAAFICRVPVVVHTYHGHVFSGYFGALKSYLVRTVEKILGLITTHIVCISQKQFEEITGQFKIVKPSKASVIPLGFDLSRFSESREEKRTRFRNLYNLNDEEVAVGIIGRFAPIKNHSLFIRAFSEAKKKNEHLRAFIIGDGDTKSDLISQCAASGMTAGTDPEGDVVFTSWIKTIADALAGLDIIVLTSINEGTPVSLIEAQAAGKPVVSTNAGGVHDCVQDGVTGFITPHDPSAIHLAILQLAASATLRREMGAAGECHVRDKFSHHRLAKDMRALYCQLLRM